MREKILRFEDMKVWQDAQEFAVSVYKATYEFPKEEMYGITSQLRRASLSVSANIAEGFGRHGDKERAQFYHIALGSLLESKNFIYLSGRLQYLDQLKIDQLLEKTDEIHKQITAIVRYFHEK